MFPDGIHGASAESNFVPPPEGGEGGQDGASDISLNASAFGKDDVQTILRLLAQTQLQLAAATYWRWWRTKIAHLGLSQDP